MSDCVTDTHALYWYLTAGPSLGTEAKAAFLSGEQGQAIIYIPSIVIAELYYLNVKYGKPLDFAQEYQRLSGAGQFRFADFRATEVLRFDALSAIPEMHDRIIAGVAYELGLPLLTCDPEIIGSKTVQTIW
ncbi:MAG TPA: PIN domain-containing protein [Thermodesulfobacteriota bacterium]|nr:PIN domain-containing protein [Thermodesulfobacteriota bacterium]